jgi:putative N6-adenine-specific DNA methylase
VDTTGPSLHKRGWRRYQGRAPLAETTAAALLILSGWDRRSPLVDPFCGSATILIEALLLASGRAPGATRAGFAFERWLGHDKTAFEALRALSREPRPAPQKLQLIGGDTAPEAIAGARENLAALGLEDRIHLELADARDFEPRQGWNAWVVTNPPYGERVGRPADLANLYRKFGARLRGAASGYHLGLMTSGEPLVEALGLGEMTRHPLTNGALDCTLLTGELS